MTKHIERTLHVHKPAARVWEYLSDFRSTNDWDPGTVSTELVSGDGGVGTVYRNVSRFVGRETTLIYTVTAVEQGRSITLVGKTKAVTSTDTITVEGDEARSTVKYHARFELHGMAKVVEPVMGIPLKKLGDDAEKSLRAALEAL